MAFKVWSYLNIINALFDCSSVLWCVHINKQKLHTTAHKLNTHAHTHTRAGRLSHTCTHARGWAGGIKGVCLLLSSEKNSVAVSSGELNLCCWFQGRNIRLLRLLLLISLIMGLLLLFNSWRITMGRGQYVFVYVLLKVETILCIGEEWTHFWWKWWNGNCKISILVEGIVFLTEHLWYVFAVSVS